MAETFERGFDMRNVTISIETSNAAFQDGKCGWELARILRDMADQFERGEVPSWPRDINGNNVGRITVPQKAAKA